MTVTETFLSFLISPGTWVAIAAMVFLIYVLWHRLTYIDIREIFSSYKQVFVTKKDILFFIGFPALLTIASVLHKTVDKDLADIMAVVLSILTSMVLTFMAMTNEKYVCNLEKENQNISDHRLKLQNEDTIAVGMYEILTSIVVLILIFVRPVFTECIGIMAISVFIYYGFYSFLLNILIMVRRLFQVYFSKSGIK